tara:strand:+ start:779 stop:1510 length:732 start_codon:yes stop_codon:yes gene_type:complete
MKRLLSYIIIIFFAVQSQELYSQSININRLELGDGIFSSGKYLIDREYGLHSLDFDETQTDTIFIAVHGFRSQGYEWVYALKKMAASNNKTFFYRWDWDECPDVASLVLYKEIQKLLISKPEINHINIFGHSYGGNIVTGLMTKPDLGSIEINSVAGALTPMERHVKRCPDFIGFDDMKSLYDHYQWRTVKDQDGAFRDMAYDPQVVNIQGSTVINLPPAFKNGKRLGHNWSLKWVLDQYFRK